MTLIEKKIALNWVLEQVKLRRWTKRLKKEGVRYFGIASLFAGSVATSGCAIFNEKGFETYAKLGVRAVDTHEEKQATVEKKCGGLRGWINGCETERTEK